ncbi:MAG: hypothetical protein WDN49_11685 [Acetobacteraceae bacterium]
MFDGRSESTIEGAALTVATRWRQARASPARRSITEDETSTFVSASFDAHIDAAGCIVMDRKAA